MKNIKYESEFIRTVTTEDGLTKKVFLNIYKQGKMFKKIDLGNATSEEEAEKKVDEYLQMLENKNE